jgi:hypothetical protein
MRNIRLTTVILLVALGLMLPINMALGSDEGWGRLPIFSAGPGWVGWYNSTAVDSHGKVHITGEMHGPDWPYGEFFYATNASGSWFEEIIELGTVGFSASIAIDSKDKIHICYHDWVNLDLKYATNASGSWVKSTIDNSGGLCSGGLMIGIAVGSNDKLHISYCDDGGLTYSNNVTGSWVPAIVDNLGGMDVSIAVDSKDKVHINYYQINDIPEPGFGDLKYATNATGSWVTSTIDSDGDVGSRTSIGLGSKDKVHISYYDYTNRSLKYTTNTTGDWVMESVDSGNVGEFTSTSLALDPQDKVHISYRKGANYGLMYATNAEGRLIVTPIDVDFGRYFIG